MLLALALIFLPIIFDGQGSYQSPLSSRIPAPPLISILPEPVAARPVIIADTEASEVSEEPAITSPITSSITTTITTDPQTPIASRVDVTDSEPVFSREIPALASTGLPQGWSVRLGSFSDSANADKLLNRLLTAGYRAYTRDISGEQESLTGVYVGPWLERDKVDEYQKVLQEEFSLTGMVVLYELLL